MKYELLDNNGNVVAHYEPPTCNDDYGYFIHTATDEPMHSHSKDEPVPIMRCLEVMYNHQEGI